jgi:AraC-like DNA-binding protein
MDVSLYDEIDCSFSIEKLKVKGAYNMSYRHYHDAYEIYYLLQGERDYFIKDRTYTITKGNLVFINMNDLHKTVDTQKGKIFYERILINFKKEFLDSMLTPLVEKELSNLLSLNSGVIPMNFEENRLVEELLFNMLKEGNNQLPNSKLYKKTLLLQLLITINRCAMNSSKMHKNDLKNENIFRIVKYLNSNYANKISLQSLCEVFFISESYLSRTFKKVTGFNIISYLNIIRIKEAQKLLINSNKNITEIAYKVGYDSVTHFERVFKSITSISPLKYRRINKKNNT